MKASLKLCCILSGAVLLYVWGTNLTDALLPSMMIISGQRHASSSDSHHLQDFRICRIQPEPVIGGPWVDMAGMSRHGMPPVDYQCSGKLYHQFAGLFEDLILTESDSRHHQQSTNLWGKRPFAIPIMGNSSITASGTSRGPLIWVGMFAHGNIPYHQRAVDVVRDLQRNKGRTNLRAVNARRYIDKLASNVASQKLALDECSIDGRTKVGTCDTDRAGKRYREGHRCTGSRGGHPDLVAWDVVEALHDVLSSETT